jgi:hypothetical protein
LALSVVVVYWQFAVAADKEIEKFETRLFRPANISSLGGDRTQLARLDASQRADILAAKHVLVSMFSALERPTWNPKPFFSESLLVKFPTSGDLARSLVAPETVVLQVGITRFDVVQPGLKLELRFFVLAMSEGSLLVKDESASFVKSDTRWVIARFGKLQ